MRIESIICVQYTKGISAIIYNAYILLIKYYWYYNEFGKLIRNKLKYLNDLTNRKLNK